jgi:hypothetical protein
MDEDPVRNQVTGQGMACARCGEWILPRFPKPFDEIAHMTLNGEYITLENFPVELYCPTCSDTAMSTGRDLTIDIATGKVLGCRIDPIEGDMTPPDEVPDGLA